MSGLRILLTNNTLAGRAGTELYVRDLASALVRRGHRVTAYSPLLGDVAAELRAATVAVVDDLAPLEEPPDLIHGQHHLETVTALARYPGVPAIYVCHGWLPWEEAPPIHPRIRRYVAVDDVCRDRLTLECGVPDSRIRRILNFVDLARFTPRDPLPERAGRALVFSNAAREGPALHVLRTACEARGLRLDVVGGNTGNSTAHPQELLRSYDLVFAKARAALEAMAVGTAVILYDDARLGPLVTSADFDALRPLNFGVRTLQDPFTPEGVLARMDRYDPRDAARVQEKARAVAGLESAADAFLSLYQEVLAESTPAAAPAGPEDLAVSRYLRSLSSRLKTLDETSRSLRDARLAAADLEESRRERAALKAEVEWMRGSLTFRIRNRLLGWPLVKPFLRVFSRKR